MAEDTRVSDTIERRKVSRDWLNDNYWSEFAEVFQLYKCRVDPLMTADGKKEDKTRTNLCMPDAWIMCRRKAARLAAKPPNLKIRAKDPAVSDFLSDLAAFQWDRGKEQPIQKKHVLQGTIFGYSVKSHWWNQVIESRRFRRRTSDILDQYGVSVDEAGNLGLPPQDNPGPEQRIRGSAESRSAEQPGQPQRRIVPANRFSPEQIAGVIAKFGPEVPWYDQLKKYDGPVSSFVFIGDFFPEPEAPTLRDSAWVITDQMRNLDWLAWAVDQVYTDPRSGEQYQAVTREAAQELVDIGAWKRQTDSNQQLKDDLRAKIFKSDPNVDPKLVPGKRFLITSEFTFRDGWPWCRWIGNEKTLLGEVPLPWDLYGRYPFSMYTPIPDLLYYVGDSSPRALRHLIKAGNINFDQRLDIVGNNLKPIVLIQRESDMPDELLDRGTFRVLRVKNFSDIQIPNLTFNMPPEAYEMAKEIQMRLQQGEPVMISFGAESQATPGSSQVATIATLQQNAGDVLTMDELENLNISLAEETEIKLWMQQQQIDDEIIKNVQKYSAEREPTTVQSLDAGNDEGPHATIADPLELQEDFEVMPEMGSTLAASDQLKIGAAMQAFQVGNGNPNVDQRALTEMVLGKIEGIDSKSLLAPPQPPAPPGPEVRVSISLTMKPSDLQPQTFADILQKAGLEVDTDQVAVDQSVKNLQQANEAGKQLQELHQPIVGAENQPGAENGRTTSD